MTNKEQYSWRADANYRLSRRDASGVFTFEDKRTGHRVKFHDCTESGFGGHVFLYYYPTGDRDDATKTVGYRCGFLDKESLPEWLITEFETIQNLGRMTAASDPRSDVQ